MNGAWFQQFDRHAGGEGLKGRSTHYCAGCGHGNVHKFIAEALEQLGLLDRTVLVSPVGCTVIMYYYFNLGNTQAAHGRAPAVSVGHKLANPSSIVVNYQGDGDIAAIGLAEILTVAQMGFPISVIFVNNAVYGMTGGQLAPTSLIGQKTTTTPEGRPEHLGQPLKMAELIAQLDGPVYVERVALYDARRRGQAKRAIRRGLELQRDQAGFSFVEILAECPTQLGLTGRAAEEWVRTHMEPVFPLGIKKDVTPPAPFPFSTPRFDPEELLSVVGASTSPAPAFQQGFPTHLGGEDVALKFAGSGGDGAQTAALLIAKTAIHEGYDATHLASYGPESRGGTSYADVHVARERVLTPAAPRPRILVAFNAPSLAKFAPLTAPGGTVIFDSGNAQRLPEDGQRLQWIGVPLARLAAEAGQPLAKNVVALGALQAATNLFPRESLLLSIRETLKGKPALLPSNEAAFEAGRAAATQSLSAA